jgi:thiol:disulfide interchange protein DsbD
MKENPAYNIMFKALFPIVLVLFLINCSYSQDQLQASATAGKKDFQLSESIKINVKGTVQDGYHINANKVTDEDLIPTSLKIESNDFKLVKASWPPSHKFKFSFSETELDVYQGAVNIGVTLKANKNLKPGKYQVSGSIHYQACNDRACFTPKDAPFSVQVVLKEDSVKADTSKTILTKKDSTEKEEKTEVKDTTKKVQETTTLKENKRDTTRQISSSTTSQNEIEKYVQEKGIFVALFLIFIAGLALNLTPCVYPLIPITISYFGAQVKQKKAHKIIMALVYILGMSVTYSVLGTIAALTGGLFGSLLQNPLVVLLLVAIFLALALGMFGLYEIRIPQSIANFSGKSRQGYFGTALMGLTVGFIAAPCIGPFVLSLLVYVGKIGNPFLGFLMFFVLSLGLGFPYIFLAVFSGSISKLPRSGVWMEGVKIIFGLIMVGLALYTAQALISPKIYEIVFPIYLIAAGFYLIVIDKKAKTAAGYTKIKYIIAIVFIIWGASSLHFGKEEQISSGKLEWQMTTSQQQIDDYVSKSTGKPTIIDFYADWCAQCKELDKYTYIDPKIIELSKKFNTVKVDLTKGDKEIEGKFKILGLPVVAFLDKNGKEIESLRVTGFLKPEEFVKVMEKALSN